MKQLLGIWAVAVLTQMLGFSFVAHADIYGAGQLPITHIPNAPASFSPTDGIEIVGSVGGGGPASITLRLDDKWNATYGERANLERTFPSGPFAWRVPTSEFKTGDGRALNPATIRQIVLFTTSGGPVQVSAFRKALFAATPAMPAASAPVLSDAGVRTSFGSGQLPITHIPNAPTSFSAADGIEIVGTVGGTGPASLTLRLDDKWNATYGERANLERTLPPGPFAWRVPASEFKTGDGRALNPETIRQIVLFTTSGGPVQVSTFQRTSTSDPDRAPATANPQPPPVAPASSSQAAGIRELASGQLPITWMPDAPARLATTDSIEIRGTVGGGPANLVLRVDDKWNATFAERANLERTFLAGAFTWRLPASELKSGGGQPLRLDTIRQIVLFTTAGGPVTVSSFRIGPADALATTPPSAQSSVPAQISAPATPPGARPPRSLGTGRGAMRYEPSGTVDVSGHQLLIEGTVESREVQSVIIRIDDTQSRDYSSRYNVERSLPPGPFRFQLGIDGLRTPNGRTIDVRNVRRIIFGPYPDNSNVVVTRFDVSEIPTLPDGAKGYALGAKEATLPAGFERIAPGDNRLNGRDITVRRRPKPDPLVANGVRGLSRVQLAAEPGRARVTVWSEDPGEWELLPQVLRRRIRVNGVVLVDDKLSPEQWLVRRYLRGRWQEHEASSDAWTAYGAVRGDRRTVEIDVGRDGISIEIDGDTPEERFVTAVLVEKAGSSRALEQVERERAEWFRSNWRVVAPIASSGGWPFSGLSAVNRIRLGGPAAPGGPGGLHPVVHPAMKAKAAPGTGTRLVLEASSAQTIDRPVFRIDPPRRADGGPSLSTQAWAGLWKLTQRDTRFSLLTLWDEQLMSDVSRLAIKVESAAGSVPRRYELWVEVPPASPPGRYAGRVTIGREGALEQVPIEIEVLKVDLPPPRKPAGFYLTYPPHLTWRGTTRLDRERQAKCDMALMTRFGLTGSAPPVTAPLRDGFDVLAGEMEAARNAGLAPGGLLYDPLRTLRDAYGDERAASIGAASIEALKRRKLPMPVFTAADEPSNPEQFSKGIQAWIAAIRRASPEIRLAGHLNNTKDAEIAGLFDVAMINEGYGLDLAAIDRTAGRVKSVWIYNTFEPRLTAGFWLTYSKAERYVQWHGRMPTADPYDPLDGRELDVQVIYPSEAICNPSPDIHRDLLRLAEGVVDQRWLLWLEARKEPLARQLSQRLRARLGASWSGASKLTDQELSDLRSQIMTLAESLEK